MEGLKHYIVNMNKENKNTNDCSVSQSGIKHIDYTPETSTISRASFFTINTKTLQQIGANHLSFYLKLKVIHVNGCFYNYSINQIAKLTGVSHATAKKNILALIKLGLAEERNNNLCLRKIKRGKTNKKVLISSKFSIQQIKDKLLLLLIERKNKQMNYRSSKKDPLKRSIADTTVSKGEISNLIGIRKLSQYLKVSPSYLSNWSKRMIKSKRLKVDRIKVNLGKVYIDSSFISHYLFTDKLGNTILYKGSVYSL